jgi:hypothetical protein
MIRKRTVTLTPVGADGSAVDTETLTFGRAGFVRALAIDYQNQPATTDIVIKADSTDGVTLFTRTSSATDIVAAPVGMPGQDETGAATAATDLGSGGWPFGTGLFFDLAQGDGQTSGNEKVVIQIWVEL